MSSTQSTSRALIKFGATASAFVLAFGVASTAAFAQDPESTAPVVSETPSTQPSAPASSSEVPPPPPVEEPAKPAAVEAAAQPADLKVTAVLDKPHYESHETVTATITVKNTSAVAAEHVTRVRAHGLQIDESAWGELGFQGKGMRIEPGAEFVLKLSGSIDSLNIDGKIQFSGSIKSKDGDANENDNYFTAKATVKLTRGKAGATVYADKNRDGKFDDGEAVADAKVSLSGGSPSTHLEKATDAAGRVSFEDIPAGKYQVQYALPGGWVVRYTDGAVHNWTVDPVKPLDVTTGAVRPFSETLKASVTLDKDVYQVGEIANITVTLTNTDDRPATGIQAGCGRAGEGSDLGDGPGWGNLQLDAPGVTIAAGETKTIYVTEEIPAAAMYEGRAHLFCDFEPKAGWNSDGPEAGDHARVLGGFGGLKAALAQDHDGDSKVDEGEGIANTKVLLIEEETGAVVASAVSDAKGNLEYKDVPTGLYRALVIGPWKFKDENGDRTRVTNRNVGETSFFVEPGPVVTEPGAPAPGGAATGLASTGASVVGLAALGLGTIAFGIGAVVTARRRKA